MSSKSIIFITTLSSFMTAFIGSAINVALPEIGMEFKTGAVFLSWIATSYLLTTATLLIPAGRLADIFGRVLFFKLGITVFTIGSLLCTLANSGIMLIIFRLFQGVGSSMLFTTSMAILVASFPANKRGRVLGINVASVYIGLSIGPFLGGMIAYYFHWRVIFLLTFLLGLIVIFLSIKYLKMEWRESKGEKFDYWGSMVLTASMVFVMIGLTSLPNLYAGLLIILGILGIFYFRFIEERAEYPVLNLAIFKNNRTFLFSNIAALINYSATFAIGFLMSLYLQYIRGLSTQEAGWVLVSQPLLQALLSPFAGKLSDKIEPRIVASVGMGIITLGLISFIFIGPQTSLIFIITVLGLLGIGFALFSSPNSNAIMSSIEKKYIGLASSTLSLMRMIGQMLSMGIVILILSFFVGNEKISGHNSNKFLESLLITFSLFTVFCVIGIFASLARGNLKERG